MLWLIAFLLIIICMVLRRRKFRKLMKFYEQLKIDAKPLPVIGHAFQLFGSDEKAMRGLQHLGREAVKQGGMAAFWVGDYVALMVADPPTLDVVLKTIMEKSDVLRFVRFLTGNGSIFAPVSIWRPRRKNLAPTFSPRNLTQFVRIFAEQSEIMADRLRDVADAMPFSIWKYMSTYTMDAVCESTLGIKVKSQEQDHHPFLHAFEDCMQHIRHRMMRPWLHNDLVYQLMPACRQLTKSKNYLLDFTENIIKEKRKETLLEKNINNNAEDSQKILLTFLDLLMKSGDSDDDELKEEMLVVLMAGSDTSAVGTAFTALMLSRHADVQERVYEELKEVFGNSDRPVKANDLPQLKYLDAVIKETLRLYPPVPVTARDVKEDFTLLSGITLPKDLVVICNIWALHRNPRYWGDDAELFRPERFLDGAAALHHPAQFMPFSYGPRNCLGYKYAMMSMTTALATMLRRYRLLPATDTGCDPDAPLRVKYNIMMKDVDNFTVRLEYRPKL